MALTVLYIVALILLLPGIGMAFIPRLPAIPYMFVVALAFCLVTHFSTLSIEGLLGLLGVALVSVLIDHVSGFIGAKYGGAHGKSLLWGFVGALLGTFLLPAFGSFIGLFVGVLAAEMYYKKKGKEALKAASGAVLGSVAGMGASVVISIVFFAAFALFAYK
jgi:uncharacterized protein YqgC (DUF456 family)